MIKTDEESSSIRFVVEIWDGVEPITEKNLRSAILKALVDLGITDLKVEREKERPR